MNLGSFGTSRLITDPLEHFGFIWLTMGPSSVLGPFGTSRPIRTPLGLLGSLWVHQDTLGPFGILVSIWVHRVTLGPFGISWLIMGPFRTTRLTSGQFA